MAATTPKEPESKAAQRRAAQKAHARRIHESLQRNLPRNRSISAEQLERIVSSIVAGRPGEMIVMAVDIRKSTILMKEAINFTEFARILSDLLRSCRSSVEQNGGWFDKFTGDGFLAYWSYTGSTLDDVVRAVLRSAQEILETFNLMTLGDFRAHSRNLPAGVGLSIGLDAGTTHLVEIAEDITIVGPAVVGAVRMVSAASGPNDVVANVYLGEYLARNQTRGFVGQITSVSKVFKSTKEYESQEVYTLELKMLDGIKGSLSRQRRGAVGAILRKARK